MRKRLVRPLATLIGAALLLAGCGQAALVATPTPSPGAGGPPEGPATPPPLTPAEATAVPPSPTAAPSGGSSGPVMVGTSIVTGPVTGPPLRDITPAGPPTVGPPMTPDTHGMVIAGMDDAGRTVELHPGDILQLALSADYDWTVTIADPQVLEPRSGTPAGGQAQYTALQAGQTTLMAQGDPHCLKATPPCGMPSRLLRMEIVVQ